MDFTPILTNVSKHIALDGDEVDYFCSLIKEKKVKKKQCVVKRGEVAKQTNYIVKGCFRLYQIDLNGYERIATFATEDYWISDLNSFLTQTPATHFLEAIEDSVIFQIQKNDLEKLYRKIPKFERLFRIMHQNAFITQHQRLMDMISSTAHERYEMFRKKYPKLEQRVPLKFIAAYLGITPEFLSMLRSQKSRS